LGVINKETDMKNKKFYVTFRFGGDRCADIFTEHDMNTEKGIRDFTKEVEARYDSVVVIIFIKELIK